MRDSIIAVVVPPALAAFVRGLERRAVVFAELQCGDANVGDAALAVVLREFVAVATHRPMADWPRSFWAALLDAPGLRRGLGQGHWPVPFASLAGMGHGPRAALLLGVVARLSEIDAAAVLGIARPTYRLALQHALPRTQEGKPDVTVWEMLDEATRQNLRDLPPDRLRRLAQMRDTALSAPSLQTASAPLLLRPSQRTVSGLQPAVRRRGLPRWLLPMLWTGLGGCVLAFSLSFAPLERWHTSAGSMQPDGTDADLIRRDVLPAEDLSTQPYDSDLALLSHRDFEQLADTADQAISDQLALYSWYAASLTSQPAQALPLPDAAQALPDAGAQSIATASTDTNAQR